MLVAVSDCYIVMARIGYACRRLRFRGYYLQIGGVVTTEMAYTAMADIVMASDIVMIRYTRHIHIGHTYESESPCIVMACVVMALYIYGLCSYGLGRKRKALYIGLCSYGLHRKRKALYIDRLCSYGLRRKRKALYSYGLCSYGLGRKRKALYSYGLCSYGLRRKRKALDYVVMASWSAFLHAC